jgi:hypothetical protein
MAARGGMWEDAATLLAASRRDTPVPTLDPAIYGPLEERCREALGDERFERLAVRGDAMSHEQLIDLVGTSELQPAANG